MHIGWFEAMITPFDVILNDLEFMGLESEYGEKKPEQPKQTNRGRSNAYPQ